jgi:hypothetical protein
MRNPRTRGGQRRLRLGVRHRTFGIMNCLSTNISITIPDQAKAFIDREASRRECSRSAYISSLIKEAEARAYTAELNEWHDSLSDSDRAAEHALIEEPSQASFSSIRAAKAPARS